MSGNAYHGICPACGSTTARCYTDHKPFDYTDVTCLECGFETITNTHFMDLDELNEARENDNLPILSELPQQNKDF